MQSGHCDWCTSIPRGGEEGEGYNYVQQDNGALGRTFVGSSTI